MLHDHRCGDHGERFVGDEQPVTPGKHVALEPAFTQVLAEDLHHAAVGSDVVIDVDPAFDEAAILHLEHGRQPIGVRLVGAVQTKVRRFRVADEHVTNHFAELPRGFPALSGWSRDIDPVAAEIRQIELAQQTAAVRVRIRSHSSVAGRREPSKVGDERA